MVVVKAVVVTEVAGAQYTLALAGGCLPLVWWPLMHGCPAPYLAPCTTDLAVSSHAPCSWAWATRSSSLRCLFPCATAAAPSHPQCLAPLLPLSPPPSFPATVGVSHGQRAAPDVTAAVYHGHVY